MRVGVTIEFTQCKQRNYRTEKNKRNDPDRIELKKTKFCKSHTIKRRVKRDALR